MTTADQLAARAMALAAGACDDDLAVAELRRFAVGNDHALDQAILACLAQPASLTARRLAIELLARALYELLAAKPQFRRLQAGRTLVEEGKPGNELFLLFDGVLRVEVDGTLVAEVGPGAILGETALLHEGKRMATLRAVTPCRVAIVPKHQIDRQALEEITKGHTPHPDPQVDQ